MMELHCYEELDKYFQGKVLLVCGGSIKFLRINEYFENKKNVVEFHDFISNPLYESVVKGVDLFRKEKCTAIIAVGGGSAIDVAKCIKLYSNMDDSINYLTQEIIPNDIPLIAVPTTAGTGSEATRYAVIYYNGEKQSIADVSCIPTAVLLDDSVLETLPEYQKKATLMDAFCQSIESFWSINSTKESKEYSKEAINIIMNNYEDYLDGDNSKNKLILKAANISGKAINITQTTAGHAMSYKLTSLYNIAHGHAVALCMSKIWPFMIDHVDQCIDCRGIEYLNETFGEIAESMGCKTSKDAIEKFESMLFKFGLEAPKNVRDEDYDVLKKSVNPVRLKNNPVLLNAENIDDIYHEILRG